MSEELFLGKLERRLMDLAERCDGIVGVQIVDLATGQCLGLNSDTPMVVASSIKVPLLIALHHKALAGELGLHAPITVHPTQHVGGSGVLRLLESPITMTISDLAGLMINVSDNTATNVIIDIVGLEFVNHLLDQLGLGNMRLRRRMLDSTAAARGDENVSSMADAARLMHKLWMGDLLDRASCDKILAILRKTPREQTAVSLLPANVDIAHKPGGLDGVACEFAVVLQPRRPYVFCAAINYAVTPPEPASLLAQMSLEVYRFYSVLDLSTAWGRRLDRASWEMLGNNRGS